MPKNNSNPSLKDSFRLRSAVIIGVAAIFTFTSIGLPRLGVWAQSYQEQITELRDENKESREQVKGLAAQAASYQDAILQYEQQISSLQAAIDQNQSRQAKLQTQIDRHQVEIDKQRQVLGSNIRSMYLDGDMTTLEMLATSKDLGDYIDKETYRNVVQRQIQDSLRRIAKLQNELTSKKKEVESLIADQKDQRAQLDGSRSQQASLLAMNNQQQAGFQQQISDNQAKIADLQAQQNAANARLFGGAVAGQAGGGGYQWGDAKCLHVGVPDPPCGQYDWGYASAPSPRNLYDSWGYGYRNCTSWVAFRLNQQGYKSFSYLGNAKQWPGRVPAGWVTYGSGASVGDAAVSTAGGYGHVMYVEAVNSNGTVTVSDYNRSGDGLYRNGSTRDQAGLYFISFPR